MKNFLLSLASRLLLSSIILLSSFSNVLLSIPELQSPKAFADYTGSYDLQVQKTYLSGGLASGNFVDFLVTLTNIGSGDVTNATVTDLYATGLTYIGVVSGGSLNLATGQMYHFLANKSLVFNGINLNAGSSGSLVLRFQAGNTLNASTVVNTANCGVDNAACSAMNTLSGNAQNFFLVQPPTGYAGISTAPYDLSVTKTANVSSAVEGDQIIYTITYFNSGANAKNDIYLEDNYDQQLDFLYMITGSASPSIPQPTVIKKPLLYTGSRLIRRDLSLGSNSTGTFQLVFQVKQSLTGMQNNVKIGSTHINGTYFIEGGVNGETSSVNNTSQVWVDTLPFDLSVQRTVIAKNGVSYTGNTFTGGDTVTYRVYYYNSGYARSDVVIIDYATAQNYYYLTSSIVPSNYQNGILNDILSYGGNNLTNPGGTDGFYGNRHTLFTGLSIGANSTGFIDITYQLQSCRYSSQNFYNGRSVVTVQNPMTNSWMVFTYVAGKGTGFNRSLRSGGQNYLWTKEYNTSNNLVLNGPSFPDCPGTTTVGPTTFDLVMDSKTANTSGSVLRGQEIIYTLNYHNVGSGHGYIYLDDSFDPTQLEYLGIAGGDLISLTQSPLREFWNTSQALSLGQMLYQKSRARYATSGSYMTNYPTVGSRNNIPNNTTVTGSVKQYCYYMNPSLNKNAAEQALQFAQEYTQSYTDRIANNYDPYDAFVDSLAETSYDLYHRIVGMETEGIASYKNCVYDGSYAFYMSEGNLPSVSNNNASIEANLLSNNQLTNYFRRYIFKYALSTIEHQLREQTYAGTTGGVHTKSSHYYDLERGIFETWDYKVGFTDGSYDPGVYLSRSDLRNTMRISTVSSAMGNTIYNNASTATSVGNSFTKSRALFSGEQYIDTFFDKQGLYRFTVFDAFENQVRTDYFLTYDQVIAIISNPTAIATGSRYRINANEWIQMNYPTLTIYQDNNTNTSGVAFSPFYLGDNASGSIQLRFRVKSDIADAQTITNSARIATIDDIDDAENNSRPTYGGRRCDFDTGAGEVRFASGTTATRNGYSYYYGDYSYQTCRPDSSTLYNTGNLFTWIGREFTGEQIPGPNNTQILNLISSVPATVTPSLSIYKSINTGINYYTGDNPSYAIQYCNNEAFDVSGVTIIDRYEASVLFSGATLSGYSVDPINRTITWNNLSLSAGSCQNLSVYFDINDNYRGSTITNRIDIGVIENMIFSQSTGTHASDAITINMAQQSAPSVALPNGTKTVVGTPTYRPGTTVTYSLAINNNTTNQWYTDRVDTYPTGLQFLGLTGTIPAGMTGYTHITGSRTISRNRINIAPAVTRTVQLAFLIPNTGVAYYQEMLNNFDYSVYTLNQTICTQGDTLPSNNTSSRSPYSETLIVKTSSGTTFLPNGLVQYTLDYSHTGFASRQIRISDSLPTGLTLTGTTLYSGTVLNQTITTLSGIQTLSWTGLATANASGKIVFTAQLGSGAGGSSGYFENSASILYYITGTQTGIEMITGINNISMVTGYILSSLSGIVYISGTTQGISGVTVVLNSLTSTGIWTGITDMSGNYNFIGIDSGSYSVTIIKPDSYTGNTLLTGISVPYASSIIQQDFPLDLQLSQIGGKLYMDNNYNLIYDTGDVLITGAIVTISTGGGIVATGLTDSIGNYLFTGLYSGNYTISYVMPSGLVSELASTGTISGLVIGLVSGQTSITNISLGRNEIGIDYDFGLIQPYTLVITKTIDGVANTGALPGSAHTWLITISNLGTGTATNVKISDPIPTNFIPLISVPSVGLYVSGVRSIPQISAGGSATLTIVGIVDPSYIGIIDNIAVITNFSGNNIGTGFTGQASINSLGSSISGIVYFDEDRDMTFTSDVGISGLIVNLLSSTGLVLTSTLSDANGNYSFTNLLAGLYTVQVVNNGDYTPWVANTGSLGSVQNTTLTNQINLPGGQTSIANNFGLIGLASSIDGYIYQDEAFSNLFDVGDISLAGVTVSLYDGVSTGTTTTNASGYYSFTGLYSGTYVISYTNPFAYLNPSVANTGTLGATTNSLTQSTIVLPWSGESLDNNFALVGVLSSIAGTVYDSGTLSLLSGVLVTLYSSTGLLLATGLTNASGDYSFIDLSSGVYTVDIVTPDGYTGNNNLNSIPLAYNTNLIDQDFPLTHMLSSIYGMLYIDDDYSYNLSNDDVLLPGVEVQLLDNTATVIATGLTNASGAYSFPGLLSGNYTLQYITPNGLITEVVNVGTIDALSNGTASGLNEINAIALPRNTSGNNYNFGLISPYELIITKSVDGVANTGAIPGSLYTWLITLSNLGTGTARNIIIDEQIPSGFVTALATPSAGTYNGVTRSIPQISAGGSATLTIVGIVDPSYIGIIDNIAVITNFSGNNIGTGFTGQASINSLGSSISGIVYFDEDRDMTLTSDAGISGLVINLLSTTGLVLATTTTDNNGNYSFTGLLAGLYTVQVVNNGDYTPWVANTGSLGSVQNTTLTNQINLPGGQTSIANNFGLIGLASSIDGYIYQDEAFSNLFDVGDISLAGVTVSLYDGVSTGTTTTNASGYYSFTGLYSGTYVISYTNPFAYLNPSVANTGTLGATTNSLTQSTIVLPWSGESLDNNFALVGVLSSIAGTVYDFGTLAPLSGVLVTLYSSTGLVLSTGLSDTNGDYSFIDLSSGVYTIDIVTPEGYTGNNYLNSIPLAYNTNLIDQDFPLTHMLSSIYGTLYIDDDYSLALSNDDVLLPGVEVQLLDNTATVIATGLTNASGVYSFPGLLSGNYTLQYITPNGLITEVVNVGTIDALSNGTASGLNEINTIALPRNTSGNNYNFGLISPYELVITKSVDGVANTGAIPGSLHTWLITLSNLGTGTARNIIIDEQIPSGFVTALATPSAGTYDGMTRSIPQISAGGSATLTIVGIVDPSYIGIIDNIAFIASRSGSNIGTGLTGQASINSLGSSISGIVYFDEDRDMSFSSDAGISGLIVNLLSSTGLVLTSTLCDANGNYSFTNLLAGLYTVQVVNDGNYTPWISNTGSLGSLPLSLLTNQINLPGGQTSTANNFGLIGLPSSIDGYIYQDEAFSNLFDAGDISLAGVTVSLFNGVSTGTVISNASGYYSFTGLYSGTYVISYTNPFAYLDPSVANTGTLGASIDSLTQSTIVLPWSGESLDNNFALVGVLSSIAGTVYDSGTLSPLSGVLVSLYSSTGLVLATGLSDTNGDYSFIDLSSGVFTIDIVTPDGYTGNNNLNSIPLAYNTNLIDQDFQLTHMLSSIYGTLYIDDDYSLALSNDDVLLPGVEVQLLNNTATVIATGLTNASGAYSFLGLLSGNYTLQYITPNGLITEVVNVGTIDALSNGTASGLNEINAIALPRNTSGNNYNFGLISPYELIITKSVDGVANTGAIPGSLHTWLITVSNLGTGTARNIIIDEQIPSGFVTALATPSAGTYNGVTRSIPQISAGGSATLTIVGIVDPSYIGIIDNIAVITNFSGNNIGTGFTGQASINSLGSSISGIVYFDEDRDMTFTSDAGISGLVINLLSTTGLILASTTTDSNGNYSFTGLLAGLYTVQVVNDGNYTPWVANTGSLGSLPLTTLTNQINLPGGQASTANNFGLIGLLSSIAGTAGEDIDGNGSIDVVFSNTIVELRSSGVLLSTGLTNLSGDYLFTGLYSGTYTLIHTPPVDYTGTSQLDVVLPRNTHLPDEDFVYSSIVTDLYVQIAGSVGSAISGQTITWTVGFGNNTYVTGQNVTITDQFSNILRSGYVGPYQTGSFSFDELLQGNSGDVVNRIPTITTSTVEYIMNNNINTGSVSIYLPDSIHIDGFVKLDTNFNNSVADPSDIPLSGILVTLSGTDIILGSIVLTTLTDQYGFYSFDLPRLLIDSELSIDESSFDYPYIPLFSQAGLLASGTIIGLGSLQSGIIPSTGITQIVLMQGESTQNNNFGLGLIDVTISTTCSPSSPAPNQTITCTVNYTNNSPYTGNDLYIVTNTPNDVDVQTIPANCVIGSVLCFGSGFALPPFGTGSYSFTSVVKAGTPGNTALIFTSAISVSNYEIVLSNNHISNTLYVGLQNGGGQSNSNGYSSSSSSSSNSSPTQTLNDNNQINTIIPFEPSEVKTPRPRILKIVDSVFDHINEILYQEFITEDISIYPDALPATGANEPNSLIRYYLMMIISSMLGLFVFVRRKYLYAGFIFIVLSGITAFAVGDSSMTPIVEEFKEQILVQIGVLDSDQVDQKLNDKIVEIDSMESRIQGYSMDSNRKQDVILLLSLFRQTVNDINLGDSSTGDTLTGDTLTGDTLTGDTLTGDTLTGDTLTGDTLTGDTLTGDTLTGDTLTGDTLTGDIETEVAPTESEVALVQTESEVAPVKAEAEVQFDNEVKSVETEVVQSDTD